MSANPQVQAHCLIYSLFCTDLCRMNEMNQTLDTAKYKGSNTLSNISIKAGKTIFYYDNCALRVNTIFIGII